MWKSIDKKIMDNYMELSILYKSDVSRDTLLHPDSDTLKTVFEAFYTLITDIANDRRVRKIAELEELLGESSLVDSDEIIYDELHKLFAKVIQRASIYMEMNRDENGVAMLNIIFQHSIDYIVDLFIKKSDVALCIFEEYLKLLVDYYFGKINYRAEEDALRKHTELQNILVNKGFYTLNDIARNILEKIYWYSAIDTSEGGLNVIVDDYLNNPKGNIFLKKYAPQFSNSEENIIKFKYFQERLIMADVYLSLKSSQIINPYCEENRLLLEYVSKRFENGNYRLPRNLELRYKFYEIFFHNLTAKVPYDYRYNLLEKSGDFKILRFVNPLYFLD